MTEKANETTNITKYLGSRGYTIFKSNLTKQEEKKIKKDLMIRPFVPKGCLIKPNAFPIFRESNKKYYLPRFYGFKTFGIPNTNIISDGDDINVEFKGKLRDYQINLVNTWLKKTSQSGCGLIEADCGAGKTVIATNIISILNKKTLIIVHKDFLLRQWKERINDFLPEARVGIIQGPKIDVEDKDIVIGMLQSLSMKEYDNDLFKQFGCTIIDETHHVSAEVFSRVLFKCVTKYMLGLSATMDRPDGLTPVFKMFLGNIEATWKRESQKNVIVKAIEYENSDEEYSKNLLNYRGQDDYVNMIGKICNFNRRTEFIIKVIEDTWKKTENQQILVIGHRKDQLAYIHDAIKHKGFATVGYYIGGMKEDDLKNSECKNVVIATYNMAAEALDIKTLSTLVMVTPKKDVKQAVGRIFRSKGDKLVIDIIDQHNIFKKHWTQRRRWYNRQEFNIMYTTNERYEKDDWDKIPYKKTKAIKIKTEPYETLYTGKCLINN
jgi:superfamily II DNA or RNA helicase